ncbi:hypothetical protein NT07LI_1995a, partial [Listeria innocua FSL S4-378]
IKQEGVFILSHIRRSVPIPLQYPTQFHYALHLKCFLLI